MEKWLYTYEAETERLSHCCFVLAPKNKARNKKQKCKSCSWISFFYLLERRHSWRTSRTLVRQHQYKVLFPVLRQLKKSVQRKRIQVWITQILDFAPIQRTSCIFHGWFFFLQNGNRFSSLGDLLSWFSHSWLVLLLNMKSNPKCHWFRTSEENVYRSGSLLMNSIWYCKPQTILSARYVAIGKKNNYFLVIMGVWYR